MSFNYPIENSELRTMLPHAGAMCLLERVVRCNATEIECVAISHRQSNNPLRFNNELPAHVGVEYCAQAIAIHGYVTSFVTKASSAVQSSAAVAQASPRHGYLAVILNTHWHIARLDECHDVLQVIATKQTTLQQGVSYSFAIKHQGHEVLTGQAIVALE
jgi:predicted hotdog family 3-hydroxylacyl-ACP dehydratase